MQTRIGVVHPAIRRRRIARTQVVIDTSPSLGLFNKVIISTVDGFVIPCSPDMFSLYGIKNIGTRLKAWKTDFDMIYRLIGDPKRAKFPKNFVQFLGYVIYNARKRSDVGNKFKIPMAHYNYAQKIPTTIKEYISDELRNNLNEQLLKSPIGGNCIIHSHNTVPNFAQKYKHPIWELPDLEEIDESDSASITMNKNKDYYPTKENYRKFAKALIVRLNRLGD